MQSSFDVIDRRLVQGEDLHPFRDIGFDGAEAL